MEALSLQDLHHLAMNHVGKELEKQGFEFIAINSQLKKHPQFVCVDKPTNTLHFVMVQAATYPSNPADYDPEFMLNLERLIREHRKQASKQAVIVVGQGLPGRRVRTL